MAYLAIDLGGSHVSMGLLENERVVGSSVLSLPDTTSIAPVLPSIADALLALQAMASEPVVGLGMGFCGLVESRHNRVLSTNGKFEDVFDVDLEAWSIRTFGVPLRLDNDARLALRGEMYAGAAKGIANVVLFTLGTGIGGVAAMDGKPLIGVHGQAGVLGGHVPVRAQGRRCTCGGRGCAEAEASGWALPVICREWPQFASSSLAQGPLNFRELFAQAAAGDSVAIQIRDHCLEIWGMMGVAAVHAFDPELILFGGGVMGSADQILPVLEHYIQDNTWTPWGKARVAAASLGDQAPFWGVPTLFQGD